MLPDDPEGDAYLVGGKAGALGEFDLGFDPEFRFAVPAVDVNVHARFFAREEKETEPAFTEYGWTYLIILRRYLQRRYLRSLGPPRLSQI